MRNFIELTGAEKTEETESGYRKRGPIAINADFIIAVYDNTVMTRDGVKFRVMEDYNQIIKILLGRTKYHKSVVDSGGERGLRCKQTKSRRSSTVNAGRRG